MELIYLLTKLNQSVGMSLPLNLKIKNLKLNLKSNFKKKINFTFFISRVKQNSQVIYQATD